jgi:hypothetical protein
MAHVPAARVAFGSTTDWEPVNILSQNLVFSGDVHIPGGNSWIEIVLDRPFVYDGVQNIVVGARETFAGGTDPSQNRFAGTATPGVNRVLRHLTDSSGPHNITTNHLLQNAAGVNQTGTLEAGFPTTAFMIETTENVWASPVNVNFSYQTYYKNVRIQNLSNASQNVSGAFLTGPDAMHFSLFDTDATWGTIAEGDFIDVAVQFNPTTTGVKNATLEIRDGGSVLRSVPLTGNLPASLLGATIFENFDTTPIGHNMPVGWKNINSGHGTADVVEIFADTVLPGSVASVRMTNGTANIVGAQRNLALISPPINNIDNKRVRFISRTNTAGTELIVGRMVDPFDMNTFVQIQSIELTTVNTQYIVPVGAGDGSFIAFRHGLGTATSRQIMIVNVTIEDLPVGAQISGIPTTLSFGTMIQPEEQPQRPITISNLGISPLNITSVTPNITTGAGTITWEPNPIPTIAVGEQQSVTFTYNPGTHSGPMAGTITIVSNDAANSPSVINISAYVAPSGMVVIGDGVVNSFNAPVRTGMNFSYTQTIYLHSQLQGAGWIDEIFYNYSGNGSWQSFDNWTMFMGHTNRQIFEGTANWTSSVPHASLTEVFTGPVGLNAVVPGGGWVRIILDEPFFYNGVGNLVIAVLQNTSGSNSAATFQGTNMGTGINRSWTIGNDTTQINPSTQAPISGFSHQLTVPNIRLIKRAPSGDPILIVSPASFDFVPIEINIANSTQQFTMVNAGGGTINVSNVSITGSPAYTIVDENHGNPISGSNVGIFGVRFAPTTGGSHTATVTITHNSTGSPTTIAISGTAIDNSILWSDLDETFTETTFPPALWTRRTGSPGNLPATQPTGTTSSWSRNTFGNQAGHDYGFAAFFNNYMSRNEWLITRPIRLTEGDDYRLGFDVLTQAWSPANTAPDPSQNDDKRFVVLAKPQSVLNWDLSHIIAEWNGDGTGLGFNGLPVNGSYASLWSDINSIQRTFVNIPPALSGLVINVAFVGCSTQSSPDTRLYLDNISMTIAPPAGLGVLTVIPPTHNFGNVIVSGIATHSFSIRNDGTAPLELTSMSITAGDGTSTFTVIGGTAELNQPIDPMATRTLIVEFNAANAIETATATLNLQWETNSTPQTLIEVELSATTHDPSIPVASFLETFVTWPGVHPHWTGATGRIEILATTQPSGTGGNWVSDNFGNVTGHTNGTAARYNLYSERANWMLSPFINLGGDNTAVWRVVFDTALTPWTGGGVPTQITANDKDFAVFVRRPGVNWVNDATQKIGHWDTIGEASENRSLFEISNTGTSIELTIPAGYASGIIQLGFYAASRTNAGDYKLFVDNVKIEQVVDGPLFAITPATDQINHGNVIIGQPPRTSAFTIRNIGAGDGVNITNIALTGNAQYSLSPAFVAPISLDSNATHPFQVVFAPTTAGNANTTLTITYTDHAGVGQTHEVDFTANAVSTSISGFPFTETFTAPIVAGTTVFELWTRHQTQFNETGTTTLAPPQASTTSWTLNSSNWGVWNFMNQAGHDLGTAAAINIWSSGVPNRCNWLVSPVINIPAGDALHLNFKYARSTYSGNSAPAAATANQKFLVIVSTDGGVSWDPADVVARWDGNTDNHASGFSMNMNAIQNFPNTTGFYEIDIDLSAYSGSIKIAFYAESQGGGDFNFYVDDFHLTTEAIGNWPVFSISPSSENITLPTALVGDSITRTFTVTNTGGGDGLIIDGISFDGHEFYRITDDYSINDPLDVGDSFEFTVTYEPDRAGGPHLATLTIEYQDGDPLSPDDHVVTFTANAVESRIFLTEAAPYLQSFTIAGDNPVAGDELFEFWSRYTHIFNETEPNILPAPVSPTVEWWGSTGVWGLRNFSNNATHTLGKAAHVNIYGSSRREWFVTPTIVVPDHHNLTLEFKYARSGWNNNTAPENASASQKFMVIVSEDNGATWTNANVVARWDGNTANHEAGISMNMNTIPNYTSNDGFLEIEIDLAGYTGEIKIAWYGESLNSTGAGDFNFYIDDVRLSVEALPVEDTWAPPVFQSVISGYEVDLYWVSPRIMEALDTHDTLVNTIETDRGARIVLNKSVLADIQLPAMRNLLRYQIYRNDVLIHTMDDVATETEFTFTDTPGTANATYTYGVRAIYEYGPSPVNEIEVAIHTVNTYPWTADLEDLIVNISWLHAVDTTIPPIYEDEELFPSGWTRFAAELDGESNPISDASIVWDLWDFPGTDDLALNFWSGWFGPSAFADWAVSPTLNFATGYEYNLSFDIALDSDETTLPNDVRLAVVLSTDNGVTWSESKIVRSWVGTEILSISATGQNVAIDLGELTGLHKLGFYIEQALGEHDLDIYIGNITIERSTADIGNEVAITRTGLYANYPNPFNPTTTISFNVSGDSTQSPVTIDIYNIRGQHVRSLVNSVYAAGEHNVVWNGTDDSGREVGSGIYFYRMRTNDFSETRKMILMK